HGGDAIDPAAVDGAALRARRDVVEHEFVGALVAVAFGELQNVAHHLVIAEAYALHDLAVADIQAGNYAAGENRRISSRVMRPSSSALPVTTAATPLASRDSRSDTQATP